MTNKEIFEQNMDELADAINEKAQTYGKKTVTEMTETVRDIHTGAVDSVNGRTGDVVLTKADVELTNVDNTSDADKPISTATQAALDQKQNTLTAGAGVTIENNVISAEVGLKIEVVNELPSVGQNGIIYLVPVASTEEEDAYDQYVYVNGNWESIGNTRVDLSGYVQKTTTIAGIDLSQNIAASALKAALGLTKSDVGLGNVDNTADTDKPVSTATQIALNTKQDTLQSGVSIKTINGTSVLGSGNIVTPVFDPTAVAGYDASKSQILTHNAQGVMTWVDAAVQSGSEVTLP